MTNSADIAVVLRGRRTIHSFLPDVPPVELIEEAIEIARWAPNHHHTEPWHFYLLGPEAIDIAVNLNASLVAHKKGEEAGEAKRKRWSTIPGWLMVTCDRSKEPVRQLEDYAACCCAVHSLSLALWTHGVGVKWTTGEVTRHQDLFELIGIDIRKEVSIGIFWYGYPAGDVPAQKRKPVSEILKRLP